MTGTLARQPPGIPAGGQFAATAHTEPGLNLTREPEMAPLGKYQVSAPALRAAREVWDAIEHQPDWMKHMTAEAWARRQGYRSEWCDAWRDADNNHVSGVVLVNDWGTAVTLSGQGRRNFSVDLDGDGNTLEDGDEDGHISPVTFIWV